MPASAADPHLEPGFPVKALFNAGGYGGGSNLALTVGNVDRDADLEIVASSVAAGPTYAWDPDGTRVPGWPAASDGYASVALAELAPGTRGLEAVLSGGHLQARTGDGRMLPGWPLPHDNYADRAPMAADVTGDGVDEIFATPYQEVFGWRADGSRLAGWPAADSGTYGQERITPAAADLDEDGDLEIISAAGNYVIAFDKNGQVVPGFPGWSTGDRNYQFGMTCIAVGDVDGDGGLEIVAVQSDERIAVYSATGALERTWTFAGDITYSSAPALADLDADGRPDIVVQSDSGVDAFRWDGTPLPGWPVRWPGHWQRDSIPVVGDVDGVAGPEVVVYSAPAGAAYDGAVRAFDAKGVLLDGFPKLPDIGSGDLTPAIADIDRDGRNEILVAGFGGAYAGHQDYLFAYDLGGGPHGRIEWGQFGGGPRHQGRYRAPGDPAAAPGAGTGSAGGPASLARDVATGAAGSDPGRPVAFGGGIAYAATTGSAGRELWRSNGTPEGTVRIADVRPGAASARPSGLTVAGGVLYFAANDGTSGRELWRTDGTAAGTRRVEDIWPGTGSSDPTDLAVHGGILYFSAWDGEHGYELWRSDGTAAGTYMVKDLLVGSGATANGYGASSDPRDLVTMGGHLYFRASWAEEQDSGQGIFRSDGTATGTQRIPMLRHVGGFMAPESATELSVAGSSLYAAMYDAYLATDGTEAGTSYFLEDDGQTNNAAGDLTPVGTTVFLRTERPETGRELYKLSGGNPRPALVRDIAAGYDESLPRELTAVGNRLWLSAGTSGTGHEPWISDGTSAGTRRVADLRPGAGSSTPADFAAAANGTVFSADAGGRGRELWRSDGTAAGTSLLQDLAPGVRGADIAWIRRAGDRIFLSADDGAHGQELWSLPATLPPPADTTPPVVSRVAEWLLTGSALTADGVPVALTWRATDDRAAPADLRFGISSRRMSGGAWGPWGSPVASSGPPVSRSRVFGNRTQARVRATDPAGNVGAYATGPEVFPVRVEDSAGDPPLRFAGTWTRVARSGASGGSVRATSTAGATATLSFKARSVGVVMPRRAGLGTASVCLDPGTSAQSCTTVDLSPASGLGERRVVWMRNGLDPATTRRVQVRAASGTVELDAFVELRP